MSGPVARRLLSSFRDTLQQHGILPGTRLGVAVSGGPDSLALAYLASKWAPSETRPVALIVDHGLRKESREEACHAKQIVQDLGLHAHMLDLSKSNPAWPKSRGKIMEHARVCRYGVLWESCVNLNIPVLMTGHHSDDQAEGFLMRLSRGSGIQGLAGIQPCTMWQPGKSGEVKLLLRPLLDTSKAQLVQLCTEQNIQCCTDPTNQDTSYIRNRIRKLLIEKHADSPTPTPATDLEGGASWTSEACQLGDKHSDLSAAESLAGGTVSDLGGTLARGLPADTIDSTSPGPTQDLTYDLMRLQAACSAVNDIHEKKASELLQHMLDIGACWRFRRSKRHSNHEPTLPQSRSPSEQCRGWGSVLNTHEQAGRIRSVDKERSRRTVSDSGLTTALGGSGEDEGRRPLDGLAEGPAFISLQPLQGCSRSVGMRIVARLLQGDAGERSSQAQLEQVWHRIRQGHVRNFKGKTPIRDLKFGSLCLRPMQQSRGEIVRILRLSQ